MITIKNPQKKVFITYIIITIISLMAIIFPFMEIISFAEGGGAILSFGIVLFIFGFLMAIYYAKRVKIVNEMFTGKNLLAQWEYSKEYWQKFATEDLAILKKEKYSLLKLVSIISLVVIILLSILIPDGFLIFLISIVGVNLLLLFVVLMIIYNSKRRNKAKKHIVLISTDGAYINGAVHTWKGFGAKFEDFQFIQSDINYFEFSYSVPGRYGRETFSFRVPVPETQDRQMKNVLSYFSNL